MSLSATVVLEHELTARVASAMADSPAKLSICIVKRVVMLFIHHYKRAWRGIVFEKVVNGNRDAHGASLL